MLGMFKKRAAKVGAEMKRIENRDLMEAIVAGSLMVAYADGELEAEELTTLENLLAANENMAHFGSEINDTINRFAKMFEGGVRMGKMKAMRELDDLKGSPEEIEEAFVMMIEIAEADGEIEPEELAVLKEVGNKLGVRLSDFNL